MSMPVITPLLRSRYSSAFHGLRELVCELSTPPVTEPVTTSPSFGSSAIAPDAASIAAAAAIALRVGFMCILLAQEELAAVGGRVAPVDVGVAVDAAARDQARIGGAAR